MANAAEGGDIVAEVIGGSSPTPSGSSGSRTLEGQWAPVQNASRSATTRSCAPTATSPRSPTPTATSGSSSPTRSSSTRRPPSCTRAPQFAEHTDEILRELGKSEDEIIQLKIDGAVT